MTVKELKILLEGVDEELEISLQQKCPCSTSWGAQIEKVTVMTNSMGSGDPYLLLEVI